MPIDPSTTAIPNQVLINAHLLRQLLYGENKAQSPAGHYIFDAFYQDPLALHNFELLVGEPSYNNAADIDRMLQTITHVAAGFELNFGAVPLIAIAVKHGNPCGAAVGYDPHQVIKDMVDGDRTAIFGGLVITNFPIDAEVAETVIYYGMPKKDGSKDTARRILDGVLAPSVSDDGLKLMERKAKRCRILVNPALAKLTQASLDQSPCFRVVRGGLLYQPNYTYVLDLSKATGLDKGEPCPTLTDAQKRNIILAWAVCATTNSNTITIVNDKRVQGNGAGQQDRVGAARLAISRARVSNERNGYGDLLKDAVAASDSFFPFPDGVETLAAAGISTVFTTSGSQKDDVVAACAKRLGLTMVAVPDAIARGFFNH
jgi:phosphoribosylaminoimidazolecarboxamide formyltransferase/IMP cyclohydrolase